MSTFDTLTVALRNIVGKSHRLAWHFISIITLSLATTMATFAQSPPTSVDFQRTLVADGLDLSIGFEISQDGRVFIASKCGGLYAWHLDHGSPQQTAVLPNVRCQWEDGLLSLALDPNFTENNYIYFQYTAPGSLTRVSRFVVNPDNSLDLNSEAILLEWVTGNEAHGHMGGDLKFDLNGNLLISTGDNMPASGYFMPGAEATAGNTNDLRGKILRITPTASGGYTIPAGNLFQGGPLHRAEIYAMGFRNPFRMGLDPLTGYLYVGDVGPDASVASAEGPMGMDEINQVREAGNFGWPYVLGFNEPYAGFDPNNLVNHHQYNTGATQLPPAVPALWTILHRAIMAGPVYRYDETAGNEFKLPAYYDGKLIFWDFNSSRFFALDVSSGNPQPQAVEIPFNTQGIQGAIDAEFDPRTQQLYVLQWGSGCCDHAPHGNGALYRFDYIGDRDGGVNLSIGSIASASSEIGGNLAAHAVDGDPSTRWESDFSDPQTLTLDLQQEAAISAIRIVWEAAYSSVYTIEGSQDGVNWEMLVSEHDGNGGTRLHLVDSTTAFRYVRLTGIARGTGYGHSLFAFDVLAADEQPPEELTEFAYLNMPRTLDSNFTDVPQLLSQTGAFSDTANLIPHPNLIPFRPNSQLWSDRATKARWISLPADTQVDWHATEDWNYPQGTVAVKHFELPLSDQNPNQTKRLETRLIVTQADGRIYGVTYRWRADNSDAELLTDAEQENIVIQGSNGAWTQTWSYPSPGQCLECHNVSSAQLLGLSTRQLNGLYNYPGHGLENQLEHWNNRNLFSPGFSNTQVPFFDRTVAIDDTSASLEDRVKSYLDTNCASCHGTGQGGSQWDARFNTPLAQMGMIDTPTTGIRNYFNYYGIAHAQVIASGHPEESILFIRDRSVDPDDRMPPLGRALEHTEYIHVLGAWITSVSQGPGGPGDGVETLLSAGKSATASSVEDTDLGAANAFDGDPTTRWSSEFADPQWIIVDLESPYHISRILLDWEAAYASAYTLEGSLDGSNWSLILEQNNGAGGLEVHDNLSGHYRYVRLTGTQRATEWGYSLWRFEVYGSEGGPQPPAEPELLSLEAPVTTSSVEASHVGANAVDNDLSTRWSSDFEDPQWIQIDLGSVQSISEIVLVWEAAYGSVYTIEGSTDGSNWSTILSQNQGVGGVEIFENLSGNYRYVRLTGTERGTPWGYSLWAFEVWGGTGTTPPVPEFNIAAPTQGQQYNQGQTVTLQVSVSDQNWFSGGGSYRYSLNGGASSSASSSTTSLGALAAGQYSLTVELVNSQGQVVGSPRTTQFAVNAPSEPVLVSQGRPVTTSSVEGPYLGAHAVDGDMSTRWASEYGDDGWIQIDLGASTPISRVVLEWEAAYASGYVIEVSENGTQWSQIFSTTSGNGGTDDLSISGQGRYIRLTGTQRATPWGISLWQFQVYGGSSEPGTTTIDIVSPALDQQYQAGDSVSLLVSISDSNWFAAGGSYRYSLNGGSPVSISSPGAVSLGTLAPGHYSLDVTLINAQGQSVGETRSSSFSVSEPGGGTTPPTPSPAQLTPVSASASSGDASLAIDGDGTTRWESAFSDPQYIQFDMGQSMHFTRMVLDWEAAYARSYTIEVSENGSSWQTVFSTTSGNGGIDDITLNGEQGRYIRMHGTERATGYGYSLWEVEIHGLNADPNLALINFVAPAQDQAIPRSEQVQMQVSISDSTWIADGGSYHYYLNNEPAVRVSHLNPVNLGLLPTGVHTLRVSLVNSDGVEVSIPQTRTFRVSCTDDCPNVLVFSRTNGFRHDSIPAGIAMVQDIANVHGYGFTATEDSAAFTAANLAQYSTIVFMNTTGDIFNDSQKAAFRAYIENGGGYVGIHSAADTEHGWDWYMQTLLGGARFIHHGDGIPHARVEVIQPNHWIMNHIGHEWHIHEEWYFWENNPRDHENVDVLAVLDRSSYNSNYPVEDHPIVFTNTVGDGRVFYTAKGHVIETFLDPRMIEQIRKAIEWTSGD